MLNFWKNKRVLLTGHTGFKGAWLSLWLDSLGAQILGYSLPPPTRPSLFHVLNLQDQICSVEGDIRNRDKLESTVQAFCPEIVIHLAAQPLVRQSYKDPVSTYQVNVQGTVNLLEAVRASASARVTVVVTSDKCYENREMIWPYRETDPMGGRDPYSSSKGCAELVCFAYGKSFFEPNMGNGSLATVRAGNVIGGGDWANDRLVPDVIRALAKNSEISLRNPNAIRPWQHVLEPLFGYLLLARFLYENGPIEVSGWNFGPDHYNNQTVGVVTSRVKSLWGGGSVVRVEGTSENLHEAGLLTLDSTKARAALGWVPVWNFEQTMEQTVVWYKKYFAGQEMREYSMHQLRAYEKASKGFQDTQGAQA